MLLSVNPKTRHAEKRRTERLQSFGLDERALQDVLFRSLDRLFPDDELVLLMQSRRWQEEPDLIAVDRNGDLFIFELKAWEAQSVNLLQVLRYGQIYGSSPYSELDEWYKRTTDASQSLRKAHQAAFGIDLHEDQFNRRQVFVVMTNGLDYRTREAVAYWRGCGLDVRPWVYRVYAGGAEEMLLEMAPFRVADNPYEDIARGTTFSTPTSATAPRIMQTCSPTARRPPTSILGSSRLRGWRAATSSFSTSRGSALSPWVKPTENW